MTREEVSTFGIHANSDARHFLVEEEASFEDRAVDSVRSKSVGMGSSFIIELI